MEGFSNSEFKMQNSDDEGSVCILHSELFAFARWRPMPATCLVAVIILAVHDMRAPWEQPDVLDALDPRASWRR